MLGAIIGDIVGSRFEFDNHRSKDFELFAEGCFATDDSIMTLSVAKAIMETQREAADAPAADAAGFSDAAEAEEGVYARLRANACTGCGASGGTILTAAMAGGSTGGCLSPITLRPTTASATVRRCASVPQDLPRAAWRRLSPSPRR